MTAAYNANRGPLVDPERRSHSGRVTDSAESGELANAGGSDTPARVYERQAQDRDAA